MTTNERRIPAGEFKARCLALLDEVAATGRVLIVTKRGRPVAMVGPVDGGGPPDLMGSIVTEGDIVSPIDDTWHAAS